jgi:hypothetical protein
MPYKIPFKKLWWIVTGMKEAAFFKKKGVRLAPVSPKTLKRRHMSSFIIVPVD